MTNLFQLVIDWFKYSSRVPDHGETFIKGDSRFMSVLASDKSKCTGCIAADDADLCRKLPSCSDFKRGHYVVFVAIGHEQTH